MRYRLTAEVEGLLFAAHPDHPLLAEADGLRFEFRIDPKDARITHVSVSTRMTEDELAGLRNTMTPDATGRPTHIRISGDEALFHRLLACLRAIESSHPDAFP